MLLALAPVEGRWGTIRKASKPAIRGKPMLCPFVLVLGGELYGSLPEFLDLGLVGKTILVVRHKVRAFPCQSTQVRRASHVGSVKSPR